MAAPAVAGGASPNREADQPAAAQPTAHFGARTEAVLVDVVVTDRKGRIVTTLGQSDFEVYENDTLQTILTFERHSPQPTATARNGAVAAGLTTSSNAAAGGSSDSSPQGPSVTALAFDRLSPEGRELAYRAAQRFVQSKQADELAGVFVVDQALRTFAPYTTDAAVLVAAVTRAANTATSRLDQEQNTFHQMLIPAETPYTASADEPGRSGPDSRPGIDPVKRLAQSNPALAAFAEMLIRMERSYSDMLYEVQGNASIDALLALVDSLGAVPGRKAVIDFCEGLAIPTSVEPRFRAVIHTANRSNVTVYTVDAAGLRVHSNQAETAQAIQEYGAMGIGDVERRGKYLDALEDNERTLRRNPSVSLGILANQTGGLLVDNTNDLEDGISRINDDRRHYYLLGYSTTSPTFDGRFHRIEVKVKKQGLQVRARSGYVAAPMVEVAPVFDYELPALEALAQPTPPAAFPFQLTPASVPLPGHLGLAVLSVPVPGDSLSLMGDEKTGTYAGGAVILTRVVDAKGAVVRKLSQQFKLKGELASAQTLRTKTLSFTRLPELPPGRYRVDAVVYDSAGQRASVTSQPLVIPPPATPVVGDLLIVDHAEPVPLDQAAGESNPLSVNGLRLKPVIGPTIHRGFTTEVDFVLPLALAPGAAAPEAKLALLSPSGEALAAVPLELGSADAFGRLLALGWVPLANVPPGRYELQVTIGSGPDANIRKAVLTVVP